MADSYRFTAEEAGERLDLFVCGKLPELSRSRIQKLLADGALTVNGRGEKAGYKLRAGDLVELCVPDVKPMEVAPKLPRLFTGKAYKSAPAASVSRSSSKISFPRRCRFLRGFCRKRGALWRSGFFTGGFFRRLEPVRRGGFFRLPDPARRGGFFCPVGAGLRFSGLS